MFGYPSSTSNPRFKIAWKISRIHDLAAGNEAARFGAIFIGRVV